MSSILPHRGVIGSEVMDFAVGCGLARAVAMAYEKACERGCMCLSLRPPAGEVGDEPP